MTDSERKAALEAIIYAADDPATLDQLAAAVGEDKLLVKASLDELILSYSAEERGIEIRAVAGGYKMYTKPQHHDVVRRFIKSLRPPLRLSMPALETLAVIAYKQPVTAPEISEIRSVNTSGVISTLLDKKLITTAGRKEVIGRPILYKTSKEFLMRFGLSDLDELPSLKEFEALAREALGTDDAVHPDVSESPISESHSVSEAVDSRERQSPDWRPSSDPVAQGESSSPAAVSTDSSPNSDHPVAQAFRPEAFPSSAASEGTGDRSFSSDINATPERGALAPEELSSSEESASASGITETLHKVEQELTAAEADREHQALATDEGMPSGQLDEDPPPPSVKSTSA
jgi:segregation and condensation protein B